MRQLAFLFLPLVGVGFAASGATAQGNWYFEGDAGALKPFDSSGSETFINGAHTITSPGVITTTYTVGPAIDLGLGYRFTPHFRVEGEFGYAHDTQASVSPLSTNGALPELNGERLDLQSGGGRNLYSGMVNAFYDLPISGRIIPYVGGGVGFSEFVGQTAQFAGPGDFPRFTQPGGSAFRVAIAGETGLTLALDRNWSLAPSYRFEHLVGVDNRSVGNANLFRLGLRRSF
jgi:opacity protein-like surface antigen